MNKGTECGNVSRTDCENAKCESSNFEFWLSCLRKFALRIFAPAGAGVRNSFPTNIFSFIK